MAKRRKKFRPVRPPLVPPEDPPIEPPLGDAGDGPPVYVAAPNAPITDETAAVVGPILAQLADESGRTDPEDVVAAAVDANSPLHPFFDWDDTSAAHAHRLSQARRLIGYVHVTYEGGEDGRDTTRAFHRVTIHSGTDRRNSGYVPSRQVFNDSELRRQVLRRALNDLRRWRTIYGQYQLLGAICAAIDEAEAQFLAEFPPPVPEVVQ